MENRRAENQGVWARATESKCGGAQGLAQHELVDSVLPPGRPAPSFLWAVFLSLANV